MAHAKILSTAAFHPAQEVSTSERVKDSGLTEFGVLPSLVADKLGITHVRQADPDVAPSDLAAAASRIALDKAGLKPTDIDAIVFCGITRDMVEPSTACITGQKLGVGTPNLKLAPDITSACHGFTAAMQLANAMIATHQWQRVLLCTGEQNSSRLARIAQDIKSGKYTAEKAIDIVGFFSCGDVGAAMVLGPSDDERGLVYMRSATNPEFANACHMGSWGDENHCSMNMEQICNETINLVKSMRPREIYAQLGWNVAEIDMLVQHQVGQLPYLAGSRVFNIPVRKCPKIFERYGNLTSASIPATLDQCDLKEGQRIMTSSTGSGIAASQWAYVV